jgi:voltage-gated potassium channel
MAVLAVAWAGLVAYELVAPDDQLRALGVAANVIWGVFALEFVGKLALSGRPLRYLRRRWPSLLFLVLPILRLFRVFHALRVLRVLPAARVVGSSYRAVGTARGLLQGRLAFLVAVTGIVIFSGGQLLFVTEGGRPGGPAGLGEALWWSAHTALSGDLIAEPATVAGRVVTLVLTAYAVVVFASVAAAFGAFFVESRAERAAAEDAAEQ